MPLVTSGMQSKMVRVSHRYLKYVLDDGCVCHTHYDKIRTTEVIQFSAKYP